MADKKSSTEVIRLKPPYKVIKHGNKIGVRTGTLLVTVTEFDPYGIETHTHPIVAVEDSDSLTPDRDFHVDESSETEVWDEVESKRVFEMWDYGSPMEWKDFINILWHDHARLGNPCQRIQKYPIYSKFLKYNKSMQLPGPGWYTIHLHTEPSAGVPKVVCSARDDIFALNVEWTDNVMVLEKSMVADLMDYLLIIAPNRSVNYYHLTYETSEEQLRPLVDRLNANDVATRFRNRAMGIFHLTAIRPYDENKLETPPTPPPPDGEHDEKYYGYDAEIWHENLDPKMIARDIIKINRKGIAVRNFFLILFEVFSSLPPCLTDTKKKHFVAWMKFNCKIYFNTEDLTKVHLSEDEKKKIEEYKAIFANKQFNGSWLFKKEYYKKDSSGKFLKSIEMP